MDRFSPNKDRFILKLYAWWHGLRSKPVIGFPDALSRIERLLICLPADPDEARQAAEVIPDLITCLEAKSTIVLGESSATTACDLSREGLQVITIVQTDRRWTGKPSSDLVGRVVGNGLSVAIDLSPQLDVLTSVLCLQSKAPVRFCFCGPHRDLFFNIQIVLSPQPDPSDLETNPLPAQKNLFVSSPADSSYVRLFQTVQSMTGHAPRPRESA